MLAEKKGAATAVAAALLLLVSLFCVASTIHVYFFPQPKQYFSLPNHKKLFMITHLLQTKNHTKETQSTKVF